MLPATAAGRYALDRGFRPPMLVIRAHTGLMAWDADWYRRIASDGYGGLPPRALRFFPLHPLLGRALSYPLGGHVDWGLLLLANAFALVLGAMVHRLVLVEGGGADTARRAAWLVALAPPAFVLVMGYSEALALTLAVGCFLALRRRAWWWAAACGVLAGLTRPVGVLLVVPALVEVARGIVFARAADGDADRPRRLSDWAGRVAAVAAPAVGAGLFMVYVGVRFGDVLLPVHEQSDPGLRGRTQFPLVTAAKAARGLVTGEAGRQLHYPFVFLALALVVVVAVRLPSSYAWYAGISVVLAISAEHLGSLERYAYGAFPLVIAGAMLMRSRRVENAVLVLSATAMFGYAVAAFVGAYVP